MKTSVLAFALGLIVQDLVGPQIHFTSIGAGIILISVLLQIFSSKKNIGFSDNYHEKKLF